MKEVINILIACLLLQLSISQELEHDCPDLGGRFQVFCGNPHVPTDCMFEQWICDGETDCSNGLDESQATCFGVDPCAEISCQNGGDCIGFSYQQHESVAYAVCQCPPGLTGKFCETPETTTSQLPDTTEEHTLSSVTLPRFTAFDVTTKLTQSSKTTSLPLIFIPTSSSHPSIPPQGGTKSQSTLPLIPPTSPTVLPSPPENTPLLFEPKPPPKDPNPPTQSTNQSFHEVTRRQAEPTHTPASGVVETPDSKLVPTPDVSACFPNPCYNGVCTPLLYKGFVCNCRPGYAGIRCERGIDACASEPCVNGGSCIRSGQTYQCMCRPGFMGRQCNIPINECLSQPCRNGATCQDQEAAFTCNCRAGFTGNLCEVEINECGSNPCYLLEGGSCIDGLAHFTCQCPPTRAGRFCERRQNCAQGQDPCQNYGICYPSTTGQPGTCQCLPGFTGRYCETNINDCLSKPCVNGHCFDGVVSYRCVCNEGYTGRNCDTFIDPCEPNPCRNNGYCCRRGKHWCAERLPINYYECYCPNGFTGSQCDMRPDPCSPEPCQNRGMCSKVGEDFHCTCPIEYSGPTCAVSTSCASQPCQNGATCVEQNPGTSNSMFQCLCDDEHYGLYCQSTFPCLNQPCMNGGSCVNRDNGYSCICPANYGGMNCNVYVPCNNNPCQNGGSCLPSSTEGFTCSCPQNFTGIYCERFRPCTAQPCSNGGSCVDTLGDYVCECPFSYSGRNCETFLACAGFPCANEGTCHVVGDSYVCSCTNGFTGPNCEVYLPCASSPCSNGGSCANIGTSSYTCTCTPGYTGPQCQTFVACLNNPCLNSGTCVRDGVAYRCQCTPAYTGLRCEHFRSCASSPCLNGATCSDLANGLFQCNCPSAYTGQLCQFSMLCSPNPCLNNGVCSVGSNNQIRCACEEHFSGSRCEIRDSCASDTCQNGGFCVNLPNSFRCLCSASYTGTSCETFLQCSSRPCLNNAECTETEGSYTCNCGQMYGGQNCENYLPCGSNPCRNGASCMDSGSTYTCVCPANYEGQQCEISKPCASSPCFGGGLCINIGQSYVCECAPQYTGTNCEVPVVCDTTTCRNGQCQLNNGVGVCVCNQGYTGPFCDESACSSSPCSAPCTCLPLPGGQYQCQCPPSTPRPSTPSPQLPCDSYPCYNEGRCINTGDTFSCQCSPPYTGTMCEKREGICESHPCRNGGRCVSDGTAYSCICQPPYTGDICQDEIRTCNPSPCKNSGTCFIDSLGVYCFCPDQYEGLFCELIKGVCDPNPCLNNGQCWQRDGKAVCDCPPGSEGDRCEQSVVGCDPNPCNEGNCVENSEGQFQCTCPPEWVGAQCQIRNPCASQPCRNAGTCVTTATGYSCVCQAGYSGSQCQSQIRGCVSQPCFNGATCYDSTATSTGFVCSCAPGFQGPQCEINIDDCANPSRCANGGTCVDLANGFRCECPAGYSGTTCNVRDNCASQPCGALGTCINSPNTQFNLDFTCLCRPEYEGPTCAQYRFCQSSPCQNGGACSNLPGGFSCQCPTGFTGDRCEQQIMGCNGVTCSGRGVCVPQGLFGYVCNCNQGYVGQDCESTSCSIQPCANGGSCQFDSARGYICICPRPWSGAACQDDLEAVWPQFNGDSYIVLPPVPGMATKTAIEVRYRPIGSEGLIMYSTNSDIVNGDFMALGLEQQKIYFQINLGAGVLKLEGPVLSLNKWYTVRVIRVERDTILEVNDFSVRGFAPEGSVGLTLGGPLWVGGLTDNSSIVNSRLNASTDGFQGCIHEVKVGQNRARLLPWNSAMESRGVIPCSADPCTTNRCRNGALCLFEDGSVYSCLCPIGFTGPDCSVVTQIPSTPSFSGTGYLTEDASLSGQELSISISFRPNSQDGLLLYAAADNDFLALYLSGGNIKFSFDLGSGPVTLTSVSKITERAWQSVTLRRSGQRGQMMFETDRIVIGSSQGSSLGLQVGSLLYIGGVPNTVEVRPEVNQNMGFSGCLRNLVIQDISLELFRVTVGFGVVECVVPLCEDNQCASGSTCRISSAARGYECICPPGRTGPFCEAFLCSSGSQCLNGGRCVINSQGQTQCQCTYLWTGPTCNQELRFSIASLPSNGYLAYENSRFIGFRFTKFLVNFRTLSTSGMILWMGNATSEYLTLGIKSSHIEVRADIGIGSIVTLEAALQNVSNNQWTQVIVTLSGPYISLEVTDSEGRTTSYFGRALSTNSRPGDDVQLSVGNSLVYLGGMPDVRTGTGGIYEHGFEGCVIQLKAANVAGLQFEDNNDATGDNIVNDAYDVNLQQDAVGGYGVTSCRV